MQTAFQFMHVKLHNALSHPQGMGIFLWLSIIFENENLWIPLVWFLLVDDDKNTTENEGNCYKKPPTHDKSETTPQRSRIKARSWKMHQHPEICKMQARTYM